MAVALATFSGLPDLAPDDRLLAAALGNLGIPVAATAWDDPAVPWAEFQAIVLRSTWDYHLRLGEFLEWIAAVDRSTRLWNPASMVKWNSRKTYLAQLAGQGVPVVPTVWLDAGITDLDQVLVEQDWTAAVLKPVVSANAWNTSVVRRGTVDPGQGVLQRHQSRHPFMLQPYRSSVETQGELSFVFVDGAFLHAVRKIPVAGDFKAQEDFGARVERIAPPTEAALIAERGLAALEAPPLYARVDLLRADRRGYEIGEIELIEPSLFLDTCPGSARAFAEAIARRLEA